MLHIVWYTRRNWDDSLSSGTMCKTTSL